MDCASASVIADGALCAITAGGSIEVVSKLNVSAIVLLHMSILLTLGQLALFTPGGCPKRSWNWMMRVRRHNCVTPSNSVRRHLLQYRSSLRATVPHALRSKGVRLG